MQTYGGKKQNFQNLSTVLLGALSCNGDMLRICTIFLQRCNFSNQLQMVLKSISLHIFYIILYD